MGGMAVAGIERTHKIKHAVSVLSTYPDLLRIIPAIYGDKSPAELPYFAAALRNYDDTMDDHSKLSALQKSFDKDVYYTLKGGSVSRFHPRHLPAPLPTSTELLDPESTKTCPNEGKLSMIVHHKA